jgi:hypothetical protein
VKAVEVVDRPHLHDLQDFRVEPSALPLALPPERLVAEPIGGVQGGRIDAVECRQIPIDRGQFGGVVRVGLIFAEGGRVAQITAEDAGQRIALQHRLVAFGEELLQARGWRCRVAPGLSGIPAGRTGE